MHTARTLSGVPNSQTKRLMSVYAYRLDTVGELPTPKYLQSIEVHSSGSTAKASISWQRWSHAYLGFAIPLQLQLNMGTEFYRCCDLSFYRGRLPYICTRRPSAGLAAIHSSITFSSNIRDERNHAHRGPVQLPQRRM